MRGKRSLQMVATGRGKYSNSMQIVRSENVSVFMDILVSRRGKLACVTHRAQSEPVFIKICKGNKYKY